jgi:hypothetical protein
LRQGGGKIENSQLIRDPGRRFDVIVTTNMLRARHCQSGFPRSGGRDRIVGV